MAMTNALKQELSIVGLGGPSTTRAELATILRFAGAVRLAGGHVILEAELDNRSVVLRVHRQLELMFGRAAPAQVRSIRGPRPHAARAAGAWYRMRVSGDVKRVARQCGLVDGRGAPIKGLPAQLVAGSIDDAEAVWRGAFLARGRVSEPGRPPVVQVCCPTPEAAVALSGAARRLGIESKVDELRGVDRVAVRDREAVAALLVRMGSEDGLHLWGQGQRTRESRRVVRVADLDDANGRRSLQASAVARARVERALQILAADRLPDHLVKIGLLRLEHPSASLDALGALAEPAISKHAVAGRLRRLLAAADARAASRGIPDTTSASDTTW